MQQALRYESGREAKGLREGKGFITDAHLRGVRIYFAFGHAEVETTILVSWVGQTTLVSLALKC